MSNALKQWERHLRREMAQDRRAANAVRQAVGPRPVTVTLKIRRELWEAHRLTILNELVKLGMASVDAKDMEGLAVDGIPVGELGERTR